MKQCLLILLLSFVAFSASAGITFEQLAAVSVSPGNLKGTFKQEKFLHSLDTTLLSSGDFEYSRGQFIRWNTLQPIQNQLTMTPTSIVSQQGDDSQLELDSANNPSVSILSEILFSVLTAEWEKLHSYFELEGKLEEGSWVATLLPSDPSVAQFVDRVELQGDGLLKIVTLFEKDGDHTKIYFDNLNQ